MEQIRVLHVLQSLNCGGAETMVMNIYRHIDRSKIQFDFLIHTEEYGFYEKEVESLGGRVFRVPRYTIINHHTYCAQVKAFFIQHPEFQIIHGHQYNIASIYLRVAKKLGRITIAHAHGCSNGKGLQALIKNQIKRSVYKVADYRLACSKQAGGWLFEKKVDYQVLNNAIDLERFAFNNEERIKCREQLNIPANTFVVGHIGGFSEVKNHKKLIKSFEYFHKKNPNSCLLLVGNGRLRNKVEKLVRKLGLLDVVKMTGVRSNTFTLLQAMDVFVFPSLYEGLGVAVIEAQAAGLPCLISDTLPEEVDVTPLIYREQLSSSNKIWADRMAEIINQQRQTNTTAVLKAYGYDIAETTNQLRKLYETILNDKR